MSQPLTRVPREIVRLSTVSWVFSDPEFPSPDWVVVYAFEGPSELNVQGVPDGNGGHLFSLTSALTAIAPGAYAWQATASRGLPLERVLVGQGRTDFLVDYGVSTTAGVDIKTHARRMVDAIEAQLEGRATDGQKSMSINGRSLDRIPMLELLELRSKYRMELRAEEAALLQGRDPNKRRRIKVRF